MKPIQPGPGGDNSITALPRQLSQGKREIEADLTPQIYFACRQSKGRHRRNELENRGSWRCISLGDLHLKRWS